MAPRSAMVSRRLQAAHGVQALLVLIHLLWPAPLLAQGQGPALSSLQSYSGIVNMPNARVMPDWQMRFHFGDGDPFRYYGGAMGFWDRLEVHGQFTEVTTMQAFVGQGYGYYKDRAAGARLVLVPEGDGWPQVAIGAFDATGTALYGSRYLVASKVMGEVDLTLGLGQGLLAGEFVGGERGELNLNLPDTGFSFLLSSPVRTTKPFGGLEWHPSPRLTIAAEYHSMDLENIIGYRDRDRNRLQEDDSWAPVNMGVKYQLNKQVSAQLFTLGGTTFSGGLSLEFPLEPEGMLPWKKTAVAPVGEGERWRAYNADNAELAALIGQRIQGEWFGEAAVAVTENSIWIEAINSVHLSDSRAIAHIFRTIDPLLPERIQVIYLNLKQNGQVIESLKTTRVDLRAYLGSYQDTTGFLAFADLDLYGNDHWREFLQGEQASRLYQARDGRFSYSVKPRVRTFLNNRSGFFKHKAVMRGRADFLLLPRTRLTGEYEVPLFNEFDELVFSPLERDSVRTDLVDYEESMASRVTMLAVDHVATLPYQTLGRVSAGIFESAYAGFGGECFRFFNDGLWGAGLEAETVRKRSLDDNFSLRDDLAKWYTSSFVNLYAQIWPEQGLEAGVKIGRFLAGDPGVRVELRRSFRYFTIGGWYTQTDTDIFRSAQNRGDTQKGVYVSFPLSVFFNRDLRGHIEYDLTSFTRDAGATVSQPSLLFPMDPWSTPRHLRKSLDEMRGM